MSDLNDPRVFLAAERTLLAWNRTSLALMAFGFVIERIGIFMDLISNRVGAPAHWRLSFWIGVVFILMGSLASIHSSLQFRKVLRTLRPVEIPEGYQVNSGVLMNLVVAGLGFGLIVYLLLGPVP